MSTIELRRGGCACGANRYQLCNTPLVVHACYCVDCRVQSGSAFGMNLWIEEEHVRHERGRLRHRKVASGSGKGNILSFCDTCGTYLWGRYLASPPGSVFVKAGTLDDSAAVGPDVQIYTADKPPWAPLHPDIPSFEGFYKVKEVWPPEKLARLKALFAKSAIEPAAPEDAAHPILEFWFGALGSEGQVDPEVEKRWWKKSAAFDDLCRERFAAELEATRQGEREHLKSSARGFLAYILLCDQMSRNIYRNTPQAFAADDLALQTSRELMATPLVDELHPAERAFVYMPLMHSEDADVQEESVRCFRRLKDEGRDQLSFAERHKEIIDRFGRFPHRNGILGRASTDEEQAFLREPGSGF